MILRGKDFRPANLGLLPNLRLGCISWNSQKNKTALGIKKTPLIWGQENSFKKVNCGNIILNKIEADTWRSLRVTLSTGRRKVSHQISSVHFNFMVLPKKAVRKKYMKCALMFFSLQYFSGKNRTPPMTLGWLYWT